MTKVKLSDGVIINAESVELVNGILKISTTDGTVEELAEMFSNKENTNLITLMTESGIESGIKAGFTSFAGIDYDSGGTKTVNLFQPVDDVEARLANAEAENSMLSAEITDTQVAIAELAEIIVGGLE